MNKTLLKVLCCTTLLFGTVSNSSDIIKHNNDSLINYDSLTEYVRYHCTQDNEFKGKLDILIDIAENDCCEIDNFLTENEYETDIEQIKLGICLAKNSIQNLYQISSMCNFDLQDAFANHKKYKSNIFSIMYKIDDKKNQKEELKK